jgi:hypothetical protein
MLFDWHGFLRFTRTTLFKARGTPYRWTRKRVAWAIFFYTAFPLLEFFTWLGFLIDDLFYRGYRRQEIREPVFIIGNPRSGTTFLHRLMAQDKARFSSMQTWEIFFAPSIAQREILWGLGLVDRLIGHPLYRLLRYLEKRCQEELVAHKFALWETEEDEVLLVHAWSSLVALLISAVMDESGAYVRFDTEISDDEKQRIMTFYHRCLQRHMCAHRHDTLPDTHYLAKNPFATSKVDTFYRWFPDAKFVYLVRNPADMISSYASVMALQWQLLADLPTPWAPRDFVLDMARHWYTYPLERLAQAPSESYLIVRYDDLIRDPEDTVRRIYRHFGLALSPAYAEVLHRLAQEAQGYRSRHQHSLSQWQLTNEQILAQFGDIQQRFAFGDVDLTMRETVLPRRRRRRRRRTAWRERRRSRGWLVAWRERRRPRGWLVVWRKRRQYRRWRGRSLRRRRRWARPVLLPKLPTEV